MSAVEQVARGARLLDEGIPGWAGRITLPIDMAIGGRSIPGQLADDRDVWAFPYTTMLAQLGVAEADAVMFGFDIAPRRDRIASEIACDYAQLEDLWTAAVLRRTGGSR